MIHVHELTKRYGAIAAIDRIGFDVAPGEILGFLGPNGAGKTTTMRIVLDILRPDSAGCFPRGTRQNKNRLLTIFGRRQGFG